MIFDEDAYYFTTCRIRLHLKLHIQISMFGFIHTQPFIKNTLKHASWPMRYFPYTLMA